MARDMTISRVAWRLASGHPVDGRPRTNATWFRSGTDALRTHEMPLRWSFMPRIARAGIRTGGVVVPLFMWWALFHWLFGFWLIIGVVLLYVAISGALYWWEQRIKANDGKDKMPGRVTFDMVKGELKNTDGGSPLLGLGMGSVPVRVDLDRESPHVGLSMGTGAGKSSMLGGIIAQGLRAGWEHVTIIDPKQVSLNALKGHPRVTICRTWNEQYDAILAFKDMMDDRYNALNEDDTITFRRRVLVVEEGNSWAEEMRMYWRDVLKGKGIPPALKALAFILFKGRQVNCNVFGAWQRIDVASVGSGSARDQLGTKILSRFTKQGWQSLIGTSPIPRASRHPGRAIVVSGDAQIITQLVYWTPGEVMSYASGPVDGTDVGTQVPHVPVSRAPGETGSPDPSGVSDTHEPTDVLVSLEEAVKLEIVKDLTLVGLRSARSRDGFPESRDKRGKDLLYSSLELAEWDAKRAKRSQRSGNDDES